MNERTSRVKANVEDESQLERVLMWHETARQFWAQRLTMANSE
jgi:hypothetical protein